VVGKTYVVAGIGALATAAAVALPGGGAGAAAHCTAWGTLPGRVSLGPHQATVHTTLHGTAACTDSGMDGGATAVFRTPGKQDDVPLRWTSFGDTDEASFYAALDRPGTYRIVNGRARVYDRDYMQVSASWKATSTQVKYQGRFARVAAGASGVTATLQGYGRRGWFGHRNVRVVLQRKTADGWTTVAGGRSGRGGHVHLAAHLSGVRDYRLVSASTKTVWGATRAVNGARV
jgi:hypothetical protein